VVAHMNPQPKILAGSCGSNWACGPVGLGLSLTGAPQVAFAPWGNQPFVVTSQMTLLKYSNII